MDGDHCSMGNRVKGIHRKQLAAACSNKVVKILQLGAALWEWKQA